MLLIFHMSAFFCLEVVAIGRVGEVEQPMVIIPREGFTVLVRSIYMYVMVDVD